MARSPSRPLTRVPWLLGTPLAARWALKKSSWPFPFPQLSPQPVAHRQPPKLRVWMAVVLPVPVPRCHRAYTPDSTLWHLHPAFSAQQDPVAAWAEAGRVSRLGGEAGQDLAPRRRGRSHQEIVLERQEGSW